MIRTFIQENKKYKEAFQINTETEEVKTYSIDKKYGLPFCEFNTTVSEMGYNSVESCINELREFFPKEVDTYQQESSNIKGLLNLLKYRKEHGYDIEDVLKRLEAFRISR